MANLQIKDLPSDVHTELRRRAAQEGVTMRDYVLRLLREDQALPAKSEWLARVQRRRPVRLDRPIAELIADDRAARDAHLERLCETER